MPNTSHPDFRKRSTGKQAIQRLDKSARDQYQSNESDRIRADIITRLTKQYQAEGYTVRDAIAKARTETQARVDAFVRKQAALHMPDKIAGGDHLLDIQGLGDSDFNSFLGTQWNSGGKIIQIKTFCDNVDKCNQNISYLNAKLELN